MIARRAVLAALAGAVLAVPGAGLAQPAGRIPRIGWLGGPQTYIEQHGHPRLRMRHARVAIDVGLRDAWLRSMTRALDARGVQGDTRRFLEARFAEVADFLRNTDVP